MDNSKTILRVVGPTKIKDGLFMGDEVAAHDYEWILMNQITHVINCCGRDVSNPFEQQGIAYLTFPWTEDETQILFDTRDSNLNEICRFMEEANQHGGAVLVHSKESDSRSCCVLSAYLMRRFKWNLFKTLEFLNSRKEDVELEPQFFQQLNSLQSRLTRSGLIKSGTWDISENLDHEEEIIRNTFLNARQGPVDDPLFNKNVPQRPRRQKLQWRDKEDRPGKIAVELKYSADDKISNTPIMEGKKLKLKSILKGSNRIFDFRQIQQQQPQSQERQSEKLEKTTESRNKSSKSVLDKGDKKLGADSGESKLNSMIGSGKTANKQNIRQFYDRNEMIKERQRISSYQRFKKAYINETTDAQPKKKQSLPPKDEQKQPQQYNQPEQPKPLSNNWMMKTDFKNFKNIQGIEVQSRKQSKSTIIVKPNLNMTVVHSPQQPSQKRAVSEKKEEVIKEQKKSKQLRDLMMSREAVREQIKVPVRFTQKQQEDQRQLREIRDVQDMRDRDAKPKDISTPQTDVYLRALKERMLIQTNTNKNIDSDASMQTKKQLPVRKQRSSSAKPKIDDSKVRERQLFTINNLWDMQSISKPKWKF